MPTPPEDTVGFTLLDSHAASDLSKWTANGSRRLRSQYIQLAKTLGNVRF